MKTVGSGRWAVGGLLCLGLSHAVAQAPDTSAERRRWLFLPGLGWTQETGWEAGLTLMRVVTFDSTRRPTTTSTYVVRSERAQTRAAVERDQWSRGNTRRLQASLSVVEYPFSFFGVGDSTTDAQEERYTPKWVEGFLQVDTRVRPRLYAIYGARFGFQDVTPRSAGLIQDQLIPGSRYSRTMILTVGATYDTRDQVVSTLRGQRASLAYGRSEPTLGASYQFNRVDFDWRGFRTVVGGHVLAANVNVVGVDGTVPFDRYAVVGGGRIMRGYPAGRFRDNWVAALQGEYRSPIVLERFGAVAFAGVGAAARRPGLLGSGRLFPSFGIGGRLQTDPVQRTSLRLDYAWGAYGFGGLYVGFNQAF